MQNAKRPDFIQKAERKPVRILKKYQKQQWRFAEFAIVAKSSANGLVVFVRPLFVLPSGGVIVKVGIAFQNGG